MEKITGQTTKMVHADRLLNHPNDGAVHSAISNSVLYHYDDVHDLLEVFQGKKVGHVYGRSSSASNTSLQNMLTDLENAEGAVTFATGMAAISGIFMALLKAGDHLVVSRYLFGNSRNFFDTLIELGISVSYADVTDVQQVKGAITPSTRIVFSETIANPVTQVADLHAIGELCKQLDLLFVLDTTMTPPQYFDAKTVGAGLTVWSLTKYAAGQGHVLGGVVVDTGLFEWATFGNIHEKFKGADVKQWGITQIKKKGLRDMGATLAPHSAHLISLGLETMTMRLQRSYDNAKRLATMFEAHPKVKRVYYPGLITHPQHQRAKQLFNDNCGAVLSIDLNPHLDILEFLNALELVLCATHLGDTRTLALPVAQTIYYENGAQQREDMGIGENMIRISVGIEDFDDLQADFIQAFNKIS